MQTRRRVSTLSAAAFLIVATASGAQAGQKVTGSGQGFYVPKSTATYKLADGRSVQQAPAR